MLDCVKFQFKNSLGELGISFVVPDRVLINNKNYWAFTQFTL